MGTDFKSVMPRDERGRWVRLPRTPVRHIWARNRLIPADKKTSNCNGRGFCFGSNGHELVTNFSVLNFLRIILVGGILDLPIKSKLLSVHRRAQQSTAGMVLRLTAKTVPTGRE